MFCKFCGAQVDDNAMFCSGCGKSLKESQEIAVPVSGVSEMRERTITVTRMSQLTAVIMKIEIFCDDEYMGILRAGESVTFEVDSGKSHRVYAVSNTSTSTGVGVGVSKRVSTGSAMTATGKSNIVQIKPGKDDVNLKLRLKVGFAAPSLIIEQV